jgi:hypothetical protein
LKANAQGGATDVRSWTSFKIGARVDSTTANGAIDCDQTRPKVSFSFNTTALRHTDWTTFWLEPWVRARNPPTGLANVAIP